MKTEQEVTEKIEEIKTTLRNCQTYLIDVVKTKTFEDFKETYQDRVISVISTPNNILHKL